MHNMLNQKMAAQQLCMPEPVFCDLLKGKRRITRINAKLLEEHFKVPAMVLQFWQLYDDEKSPPADQNGMVLREKRKGRGRPKKYDDNGDIIQYKEE
jgi:hypothetical protein